MRPLRFYTMVIVCAASQAVWADVVTLAPSGPYITEMRAGAWSPQYKAYTLENTTFAWIYWRASTASGQVVCQPEAGWIAPLASCVVTLQPAASMGGVQAGTYTDRIQLDFDTRVPGDINGDGVVDLLDVMTVVAAFGTDNAACDLDTDGHVGIIDVLQVIQHFQTHAGATAL